MKNGFFRGHGLGNDYIVLDPRDFPSWSPAPTVDQIRVVCHRNFGVGSDGILWGPLPSRQSQFGLRIFNPDGSEAEILEHTGTADITPATLTILSGGTVAGSKIYDGTTSAAVVGHIDVYPTLLELLGLPAPAYAHHRLILDAAGKKFSKRDAAATLAVMRSAGRSPAEVRALIGL